MQDFVIFLVFVCTTQKTTPEMLESSIRNSSGTQNAKTHSPFSRHLRAILTEGGWIRQSYINAGTQVFYEKKNRGDNRIHQSHRVFEKHEKKYNQN